MILSETKLTEMRVGCLFYARIPYQCDTNDGKKYLGYLHHDSQYVLFMVVDTSRYSREFVCIDRTNPNFVGHGFKDWPKDAQFFRVVKDDDKI